MSTTNERQPWPEGESVTMGQTFYHRGSLPDMTLVCCYSTENLIELTTDSSRESGLRWFGTIQKLRDEWRVKP